MTPYRKHSGFTLVELSIVLIIVALLAGGMLMSLSSQQNAQAIRNTETQLATIQETLIGFAIANRRLPRPAISATNGLEQANCADETACTGFIPWQTLGIRSEDSWGKLIRYSVTPNFANSAFSLTTAGTKKIRGRDTSGNLIYLFGQASACNATDQPCAPAVIYSHGQQRWGTNSSGVAMPPGTATSVDENANNAGGTEFFSRTFTDNVAAKGGEFDDLVVWLSPNILYNRMIAAGRF